MVPWNPRPAPGEQLGREAFAGRDVAVAGWGVSGRSAAWVLDQLGARVHVLDANTGADLAGLPAGATFIVDPDPVRLAELAEAYAHTLLVASPGWPPHHPVLAGWRGPVWSEVELAWHIADPNTHWLTLTGTNGKTTTVGMLASILEAAGRNAATVGNVGVPIAQTVLQAHLDGDTLENLAVELSSFQLHYTRSVSAVAAAVLNLADDHLDWHGSPGEYARAKGTIFNHTRTACVYNAAVPATRSMVEAADVVEGARAVGFTLAVPGRGELGIAGGALVDRAFIPNRASHGQVIAELTDLAHLAGAGGLAPHLVADALAAAALARADGVSPEAVAAGLASFRTADHRMQPVATVDGVHYVNDSKATNAHAAAASLAAMDPGSTVWILGGLAKGAQFDDLVATHVDKLRAVVLIGVDPGPFEAALTRHAPKIPREYIDPGDDEVMISAVRAARRLAHAGDTVLLAPAGASMDQFRSYSHRGDAFTGAVGALAADAGIEPDADEPAGS